jgi:transcriptional regulator with XRE-family HTH domain
MDAERQQAERLGQRLRDAREARELSLEEVEQALRIRLRFLAAFEEGQYEDLPGVVQARGFLRNYARFLRLDEESTLEAFDAARSTMGPESFGARHTQEMTQPVVIPGVPDPLTEPQVGTGMRRRSPLRLLVMVVLGVGVLAGLCYGGMLLAENVLNTQANLDGPDLIQILPTAPTLTPSSTFSPSVTPQDGQAVAAGPVITDRVVLDLIIDQRTFLRVTADGEVLFEGVVTPGTELPYNAQDEIILEASNGAGVIVTFNNLTLGALAGRGEPVTRSFTPDLALTPTALPTVAPTATPNANAAPTDAGLSSGDTGQDDGLAGPPAATSAGSSGNGPTPLPIPGVPTATQPAGLDAGQDSDTAQTDPSTGVDPAGITAQPNEGAAADTGADEPLAAPPTATETFSPQPSATPLPSLTPTATAILPPRVTSTPRPQKSAE